MNTMTKRSHFLVVATLLAVLMLSQLAYAQAPEDCAAAVPQWVRDRQQYEIGYVYVPQANNVQAAEMETSIPQWALDRQQYETSYVYVPPVVTSPPVVVMADVPQWVRDRQQYETSYVYEPPTDELVYAGPHC